MAFYNFKVVVPSRTRQNNDIHSIIYLHTAYDHGRGRGRGRGRGLESQWNRKPFFLFHIYCSILISGTLGNLETLEQQTNIPDILLMQLIETVWLEWLRVFARGTVFEHCTSQSLVIPAKLTSRFSSFTGESAPKPRPICAAPTLFKYQMKRSTMGLLWRPPPPQVKNSQRPSLEF